MFERYTDRARRAVVLAQEAAREYKHPYIGTEHLLLGVMREGEGIGALSLAAAGARQDEICERILRHSPEGKTEITGHIPFTPQAREVIQKSLMKALELAHSHIGTEHILLALCDEEYTAAQVLAECGIPLGAVRREVIRQLHQAQSARPFTPIGAARWQQYEQRLDELQARLDVLERRIGRMDWPGRLARAARQLITSVTGKQ